MGEILARTLREAVDSMDGDRSEIVERMASEAGISVDTVNEIMADPPTIDCPPIVRLQGFARVVPRNLAQLRGAAERDGCSYQGNSLWYKGKVDN